jgi:glyoxylate/hydroxypyruvate/2-ketogluconate reductase
MTKAKVLITRQVFPKVVEFLSRQFDVTSNESDVIMTAAELADRMAPMDGALTCITEKIDAALLDRCPKLKVVSNIATGYNNIDIKACSAHGVMVTNTPGVLEDTTADLAFALLLAAARRVTEAEAWLRAGAWRKAFAVQQLVGCDIHHATLGIIGMGRIGQAIARRAHGFDMRVLYHNRSRLAADQETQLKVSWRMDMDDLLKESDFVVVMVPYSQATHHIIAARELALMKTSAILINTARGGVVDDAALIGALKMKRIAGAGLDVFENEPKFDPAFLDLKNVVLTPHIGSATLATRMKMAMLGAENLAAALSGKTPPNIVNRDIVKSTMY